MTETENRSVGVPSLSEFQPRLAPGIERAAQEDGGITLAKNGRYGYVPPKFAGILDLLDGEHTFQMLIARAHEHSGKIDIVGMLKLLGVLANANMLDNSTAEMAPFQFELLKEKRPKPLRIGVPIPGLRYLFQLPVMLTVGVLCLFLTVLGFIAVGFGEGVPSLGTISVGDPHLFLAILWISLMVAVSYQALWRALAVQLAGRKVRRVGISLYLFFIPGISVDTSDIFMAGRKGRILLSLTSLFSPLSLIGVALFKLQYLSWADPALWPACIALAASGVLLASLCPFFETDFSKLIEALSKRQDIRGHGISYLAKKMLTGLFSRGSASEWPLVGYATLALAWLVVVWRAFGLVLRNLEPAFYGEAGSGGIIYSIILLVLPTLPMLIVTIVIFSFITRMLAHPVGGPAKRWLERKRPGTAGREREMATQEALDILKELPLFQPFPPSELKELSEHVMRRSYPAKKIVVKQGEPGDEFFVIYQGEAKVIYEHDSGKRENAAILGPGDGFGEIALLEKGIRTATVCAIGDLDVLVFSQEGFNELVEHSEKSGDKFTELLRRLQILRQVNFTSGLSPAQRFQLTLELKAARAAKGKTIIREGDTKADAFFIVREGSLEVIQCGERITTLGPGEFFGEIALFADIPRVATVRTLEDTRLLILQRDKFLSLVFSNVQFGAYMQMSAAGRWQETEV